MNPRYFLAAQLGDVKVEREVSLAAFCAAERRAGLRPQLPSNDPRYMTTPATRGFGCGSISGRVQHDEQGVLEAPNAGLR